MSRDSVSFSGRFAMIGFGHWELLIVAFVAFLFFGHRLPGLMNSLGSSLRTFREGMEGEPAEEPVQQ
jgi:TatA/E family protein of Tat protein translocase